MAKSSKDEKTNDSSGSENESEVRTYDDLVLEVDTLNFALDNRNKLIKDTKVQGATWRSMVQGEGQVKGSGMNASRLGPRDPKKPGGVTVGPHGAWTNKGARGKDATALGRVGKDVAKSSRRRVRWARAKDSKASSAADAGHASSSARSRGGQADMEGFGGLGLKTTPLDGFPVSAAKSGADLALSRSRWRARGAIAKLASR
ncbi:hypothetical protein C2845_PM14G09510 [Panicum miliaceum]|uniref:Uncharacterized protein n=1 Tax=Panicum miliaceum TaxID=4540 RepID=A0A3L6PRA7_PANMI|nr:hypothetical protein C2845_PM14G09510 [Panicum miliaceum]